MDGGRQPSVVSRGPQYRSTYAFAGFVPLKPSNSYYRVCGRVDPLSVGAELEVVEPITGSDVGLATSEDLVWRANNEHDPLPSPPEPKLTQAISARPINVLSARAERDHPSVGQLGRLEFFENGQHDGPILSNRDERASGIPVREEVVEV